MNNDRLIYLDYASTTPVDERVASKMAEFMTHSGHFGNPASQHDFGKKAKNAVEEARKQVASLLNAKPENIIWTSGATESNNLAIKGVAEFYKRWGRHIITSQTEHRSVLDVFAFLMQQGFEVTFLKPNNLGIIEPESLKAAIRNDTILVSLMHVNNEIGVIQDIEAFGKITRENEIIFHVDAAQSAGKQKIDLAQLNVDLMSLSAHKLYGPKGMGALYVCDNPKARLVPLFHGSGQERNLRSGTLPTHQIVGMGEAYRIAAEINTKEMQRLQELHTVFWDGIKDLPGVHLNGHPKQRVPNILNICFERLEKEKLLEHLTGLAMSTSSACTAASIETSHVLRAMGLHNEWAHRSIRFSLGRHTTLDEINEVVKIIHHAYGECGGNNE